MPLHLSHALPADLPALQVILRAAFVAELDLLMFTTPPTPAQNAVALARNLKMMHEDRTARFIKVTDTATNAIISWAKWHVYETPRPREAWEKEIRAREWPPGANIPLKEKFFGALTDMRIKYTNEIPNMFLNTLTTHPAHHRRGAGSMIMEWGANEADRLGLESYLEASPIGKPLYERFGFEQVDDVVFDLRPFGGRNIDHHAVMMRKPRPRN